MTSGAVVHAIQLAVAPVFMLAAVAAMIGAVATRLARIIDRARVLDDRLATGTARDPEDAARELDTLKLRGSICNWSVGLLAVCGMLIGATVMVLFVGGTGLSHTESIVPWTFLAAVGIFVLALLLFVAETLLATHALRFANRAARK